MSGYRSKYVLNYLSHFVHKPLWFFELLLIFAIEFRFYVFQLSILGLAELCSWILKNSIHYKSNKELDNTKILKKVMNIYLRMIEYGGGGWSLLWIRMCHEFY